MLMDANARCATDNSYELMSMLSCRGSAVAVVGLVVACSLAEEALSQWLAL